MTCNYFFQLICFVWLIDPLFAATSILAQPGCRDTCGNVTIPYPFGIGARNCFLDEWFQVLCVDNKPYLSKYYGQEFGGEVLDVSLQNSITVNANNTVIRVCDDKVIRLGSDLSGSPFIYDDNSVIFVGCGSVMLFADQTGLTGLNGPPSGCASTCDQNRTINSCFGINCCEIRFSFVQQVYLNYSNLVSRNNSCGYVIFGNNPTNSASFSDPSQNPSNPVLLRWTIPESMGSDFKNNSNNCEVSGESFYAGYVCSCEYCTEGNPYITNGCQGRSNETNCQPISPAIAPSTSNSREKLILIVVGGTTVGIAFLGTTVFLLYKLINKERERKLKEKFFIRNGGLLLQQQSSVDKNMVDKVRFFTSTELDKATDYFNENRVLGRGGQGTVYKGMLIDGKIVAVKKSKLDDKNQVEQFINEVVLLSQINHRNVVKLLGCCLETHVPLLVYEFIPNGTLYDLLHNEDDEILMSWDMRLRIAIEVAGALAYLHSANYVPIYHRDVKSSNILLDEKHVAKVSDFGISRHVTIDQTHLTTMVKGTFGYLDPEYFQSNQFSDKSDVYSYGVILVELLTRQKPISSTHNTEESCLSLVTRFLTSMEEDRIDMILDSQIVETATDEQIRRVATLAQRCLSLDGKTRPTMKEVLLELESIKMAHMTLAEQTNSEGERGIGVELVVISDGTSSPWTTTNDSVTSSSDAYRHAPKISQGEFKNTILRDKED